uniref:Uncharacterized protein n=1 Tax=Ciona intestinalis TaxID=7719 RepID=H2XKB8_CIOIN
MRQPGSLNFHASKKCRQKRFSNICSSIRVRAVDHKQAVQNFRVSFHYFPRYNTSPIVAHQRAYVIS